ncbi:MAG TPA: beta-ketoacyl-ACP synthase 3 [Capillimicrobium sp.]|nr:beta-ketoacyl-ACP synthase 3 [Capillimicrobium sp.]
MAAIDAPAVRVARTPRPRPTLRAGVFGIGAALPDQVITNDDLVARLDTSDEWIVRRTGIRTRYHLRPDESLARLAAAACTEALADAGRDATEVDRLIVSTITPDRITPGLAPMVAGRLGCRPDVGALDLNAACAGFLVALDEAAALVESGRASVVLVCGAEALSRITDHDDRGTAVLFGDGAGAVVVAGGDLEQGVTRIVHGSDPAHAEVLYADREERKLRMDGQTVYRHAVARMVEATQDALAAAGMTADDLDLFVAHQANARIIEAAAAELGVDADRVLVDVDRCANTSSATIPLALHRAEREGRLAPGAVVGLAAFGAGFVWSAGVVRWKERVHVCA